MIIKDVKRELIEVSKHGSEVDCWLIINNTVYDVGQYLMLITGIFMYIFTFPKK